MFQDSAFHTPITFTPLLKERIWGGTRLSSVLGRTLPQNACAIGESWEICDRPDDQSIVSNGPLKGTSLNELWRHFRTPIFGAPFKDHPSPNFPLLFKILDATDTLSVQVHPPASVAPRLGGEPKTEAWHILESAPDAHVFAGFNVPDLSVESLRKLLSENDAASVLHRIPVRAGDTLFIPSGRCHSIGAGCLIAEIQQNSDTTYRLFDWNRVGPDGQPRELHTEQALQCLDFADLQPTLHLAQTPLLNEFFHFHQLHLQPTQPWQKPSGSFAVIHVLTGTLAHQETTFSKGETLLVPASMFPTSLAATDNTSILLIQLPVATAAKEQSETP
jgi:mannose-6-phosphate isomerase